MEAARAELSHTEALEAAEAAAELEVVSHGHVHEAAPPLRLLDEIKMEAAQRGVVSSKSIEMQTVCGCGTCPPCLSITVWNAASLIVPAVKVMSRRRKNKEKALPG